MSMHFFYGSILLNIPLHHLFFTHIAYKVLLKVQIVSGTSSWRCGLLGIEELFSQAVHI